MLATLWKLAQTSSAAMILFLELPIVSSSEISYRNVINLFFEWKVGYL